MSFYTSKKINELRTAAQFYRLDAPAVYAAVAIGGKAWQEGGVPNDH